MVLGCWTDKTPLSWLTARIECQCFPCLCELAQNIEVGFTLTWWPNALYMWTHDLARQRASASALQRAQQQLGGCVDLGHPG